MVDKKTTPEFKAAFLAMLEQVPNITAVCRVLGINRGTVSKARNADPDFDKSVLGSIEEGYDPLEHEARRRAVDGVKKPVFYKGEEVAEVREYSDVLLMFLLKGYRPDRFNPGAKLSLGDGTEKVTLNFKIGGD